MVDRVDLLEGLVDPFLLAELQGDVDALLGRTDALEGVTGGLTSPLSGLTGLGDTVDGLTTGDLTDQVTTLQGTLSVVCGLPLIDCTP